MGAMEWPTVAQIVAWLYAEHKAVDWDDLERGSRDAETLALLDEPVSVEVRLQVYSNGSWAIRVGDSQYDLDHHGYWGAGSFGSVDDARNLRELAEELLDQAKDEHALAEGDGEAE